MIRGVSMRLESVEQCTLTIEAGLKFLVHHAFHDVCDVSRMRIACTVVHCFLVDNIVRGMACLRS